MEKVMEFLGKEVKKCTITQIGAGCFFEEKTASGMLPPFTRIELLVRPGEGSNIRIEVWLPDESFWNGRFVGTGNGGMAGEVRHERLSVYLEKGYACANTDMGTSGGELCGFGNSDVRADFGWRATHIMTKLSKALIREYYGRAPVYSYFVGASTGGQQAFSEAQRFPGDYDGICAGVPGFYRTALHMYFCWNYVNLHSADGTPVLNKEEICEISRLAPIYFKEKLGAPAAEPFVSYPWHGNDTPVAFVSWLSERCRWMTEKKAAALRAVYSGPADPVSGKRIYCGMPIGAETQEGGMLTFSAEKCPNFYPFLWTFGPEMAPAKFDFSEMAEKMQELLSEEMDAVSTDLSGFSCSGGKMIGYSGSADPWVPYAMSFDYVEKSAEKAGGIKKLQEFFRYFLIPGRAHHGGPGMTELSTVESRAEDVFQALVEWVEDGVTPDTLIAVGNGMERSVYPYGSEMFPFADHQKTW